jgi:hypothetical protein
VANESPNQLLQPVNLSEGIAHGALAVNRLMSVLACRLVHIVCVTLGSAFLMFPLHCIRAQALSGPAAAIHKQLGVWNDQPSSDPTPISFSIDDVQYKVPRNYITWMDNWSGGPQTLVRFKVTFPGFQPFNQTTRICMLAAPANRPAGCTPFEFLIRRGSSDPTDDERFTNIRKLFHSQNPLPGPFGFDLYEIGPPEARTNTYRKMTRDHMLMLTCFAQPAERTSICDNHSRLPNGNQLAYHFYGDQLEIIEQVHEGIRVLIATFTLPERR